MGFLSSVRSLVSSTVSSIRSTASAVSRGIGSVAAKAWDTAKNVASKTMDWMADKAENFVGSVKEIWKVAKPFVEKLAPHISSVIAMLPFPWAGQIAKVVEKGIQALLALENSPILQKIEQAILWASKAAHEYRKKVLTQEEEKQALQRQKDLQEAMDAMETEEQRQSIRFAVLINDYILVQTKIQSVLEQDNIQNFEHFLRLRATQKLLKAAEKTLSEATSIDEIKEEDVFLLRIGSNLLADRPVLTDADAERLDSVIRKRFNGKTLIPFVFEELIRAWGTKLENMNAKWELLNKKLAGIKRKAKQLEVQMKIETLNDEEQAQLAELRNDILHETYQLKQLAELNRAMQSYVYAAEGFLQVLEKSAEQFEQEGRDYILDDVAVVGRLLIDCAQNGKQWQELSADEQSLINDYALIFADDSKTRNQELDEIEVA